MLQQREKTTIAKADAVFMFWINCEEVNERITNKIGKEYIIEICWHYRLGVGDINKIDRFFL